MGIIWVRCGAQERILQTLVIDYEVPVIHRDQQWNVHREGGGRPGTLWRHRPMVGQDLRCRGAKCKAEVPRSPARVGKGRDPGPGLLTVFFPPPCEKISSDGRSQSQMR